MCHYLYYCGEIGGPITRDQAARLAAALERIPDQNLGMIDIENAIVDETPLFIEGSHDNDAFDDIRVAVHGTGLHYNFEADDSDGEFRYAWVPGMSPNPCVGRTASLLDGEASITLGELQEDLLNNVTLEQVVERLKLQNPEIGPLYWAKE